MTLHFQVHLNKPLIWIVCAIWIAIFTSPGILATDEIPSVSIRVVSSHLTVTHDKEFILYAEYKIPDQTHLTQNFLEIKLEEGMPVTAGLLQVSPGVFEEGEVIRRGTAVLKLPVNIIEGTETGQLKLRGSASYQICTEGKNFMCFPPRDVGFEISVNVGGLGSEPVENPDAASMKQVLTTKETSEPPTLEQKLKDALAQNSFVAFLLVFIAGFFTSLTPCVYPMIPITIGYIGGRSAGAGKWRGFSLSVFYVMGLAIIYSCLGVFAALTSSLFGSITQTPVLIGIVALIFFLMGLSMLGLFDLTLPSFLTTRLQSKGPRKGFLGAFLMGMVAGLVAAPCAGPVIVALLAFIAATRNIMLGFLLMMAFALGMGILFLVLGTFSGLLSSLPQAGMWMDKIKKAFGIIMIAAAIWIVRPLLPPPVNGLIIGMGMLLFGAGIGAFDPLNSNAGFPQRSKKALAILIFILGCYLIITLLPVPGRVIPQQGSGHPSDSSSSSRLTWKSDIDVALKEASRARQSTLVDFTAEWCAACKELEHKTFTNEVVIAKLQKMSLVRVDCTDSRNPLVRSKLDRFAVTGLPTVIILDSEGMELSRMTSYLTPADFLKFIESSETGT